MAEWVFPAIEPCIHILNMVPYNILHTRSHVFVPLMLGLAMQLALTKAIVGKSASSKLWTSQVLWVSACPSWAPVICP